MNNSFLPGKATDRGVTAKDNRRFVEAVLWILRTGSPWRDLSEELGHWHRTFVRFPRWREKGVWAQVATALRGDAEMEHLFIDSAIVRAHPHSSSCRIPDDWIDNTRYPLFKARSVMRALIEQLQSSTSTPSCAS